MPGTPKVEESDPDVKNIQSDDSMNLASGSVVVVVENTYFKVRLIGWNDLWDVDVGSSR